MYIQTFEADEAWSLADAGGAVAHSNGQPVLANQLHCIGYAIAKAIVFLEAASGDDELAILVLVRGEGRTNVATTANCVSELHGYLLLGLSGCRLSDCHAFPAFGSLSGGKVTPPQTCRC